MRASQSPCNKVGGRLLGFHSYALGEARCYANPESQCAAVRRSTSAFSSIAAKKARAVNCPTPGIVISGRQRPLCPLDRGDRHRYGGPRRNQTPHGDRETNDPLPCRRSLVDEGGGEREGQFRATDTQWGPGMSF